VLPCSWPTLLQGVLESAPMSTARAFVPRPLRRGLVSQEVDGELLLYVEATHQASALNTSASRIWALCDGARTVGVISQMTDIWPDVVIAAIRRFAEAGLLENALDFPSVNLSRRRIDGDCSEGGFSVELHWESLHCGYADVL
jgi:hypothetical protein